jgi:PAN domain
MKRARRVDLVRKSYVCIRCVVPVVAIIATAPSFATAQIVELNTDRAGSDYRNFTLAAPNYEICLQACEKEDGCKAWTYVQPGLQGPAARCWLKSVIPNKRVSRCCISGYKKETVAKPDAPEQPVGADVTPPSLQGRAEDSGALGRGKPDEW